MSFLGWGFPTTCERRSNDITIHWWQTVSTGSAAGPIAEGTPCFCGERRYKAPDLEDDE